MYRDAIVVESWEGTHNTLCAQILRDLVVRDLHRPWLDQLRNEVAAIDHPDIDAAAVQARSLLDDVEKRIHRLLAADEITAAAHIRHVVDHMCRVTDWVALAAQLQWEKALGRKSDTADALELYRLTMLENVDPQETPELIEINRRFSKKI